MQTQTSNTLHNAIMEAGCKDRPPMLAPVQIILTGIDNDIYSTVDACPNACEMWKAIKRLKQEEAGIQLNAEQADWRDDTDDDELEEELEAHYMYMAQLQ
nr:hypothetical protein [Tanacetum cinerariifolium]